MYLALVRYAQEISCGVLSGSGMLSVCAKPVSHANTWPIVALLLEPCHAPSMSVAPAAHYPPLTQGLMWTRHSPSPLAECWAVLQREACLMTE